MFAVVKEEANSLLLSVFIVENVFAKAEITSKGRRV